MTAQDISDVGARLTDGDHVYKSPYANVLVFAQCLAPNTWPLSRGDFDMVIDRYLGRGASEMTVMKEQLAAFTRENGGRGKARILNGHGLSSDKLLIGRTAFISFDSGERVYVLDPTLVTLFNQRESAPSG